MVVPISSIPGNILTLAVTWAETYAESFEDEPPVEDPHALKPLSKEDRKFFEVDKATLCAIIQAANFLDCDPLLSRGAQALAEILQDLDVAGIRKEFNIKNDFTPEEEKQISEEIEWFENL
eukprot:TRINITY_DN19257_c0_g1_i1.p1 TRINITY_DN19257_c0_g1~~TRINITY_DN19257_c0_g1_i1.p1  ORF type:complete len:132 (-),score=39.74 TRINITY_DN19257_c0_g1_i1:90-452(-)